MALTDGKKLTPADSAWLRMELPENLMTITGVIKFKDRLPYESLCRVVEEKLLVHDRFRQRIVPPRGAMGRPRWVERDFSLGDHVIRRDLPAGAGKKELQDFVSAEMSRALTPDLPMWRFYLFEDFMGGSAMVGRIHHCIGDGIALMKVVLALADPVEDESIPTVGHRESVGGRSRNAAERRARVAAAIKAGSKTVGATTRLFTLRADPRTRFKGQLAKRKRAVWSEQIPLVEVKEIGKALGGTINDVLLTAAAGALRGYLRRHGEVPERLRLRAVVPVNIRPPEDFVLGNKFGLVFLKLPVGVTEARSRLRELKADMDRLKRSPEAFVTYGLLRLFGNTNAAIQGRIVKLLSKNASAVMTNVPGPRAPIAFAGSEIEHFMFWVPVSGRLGMGLSILSYNDQVRVGIATDENLVPDPETLVDEFHATLEELKRAAGMEEEPPTPDSP